MPKDCTVLLAGGPKRDYLDPQVNAIKHPDGHKEMVTLTLRLDTQAEIEYVKRGGILPYVLEGLAA